MMQQAGINGGQSSSNTQPSEQNQSQQQLPASKQQAKKQPQIQDTELTSNFDHYGSSSINITAEALRIGKLPIETISVNIAKGLYAHPDAKNRMSPRVLEIINQSDQVMQSFKETD